MLLLLDVHRNLPPLPLIESQHAEETAGRVADEDRDPDVDRIERAELLDEEADAERDDDLRRDRDVERALGVAGSLQPAGVGQRHGDQEARDAQDAKQLDADLDDRRFVHPENREQLPRDEQKEHADDGRAADAIARGDVHRAIRAVGMPGAEILSGDRRRRTHEPDRRPGDQ